MKDPTTRKSSLFNQMNVSPSRPHSRVLLFIFCIVALLALPALTGWLHSNARDIRLMENRNMAVRPPLGLLRTNAAEFVSKTEAWLKDAVGFRMPANALFRKCRYFVFHDPPTYHVTLGKGGHIFLNSQTPLQPYQHFDALCLQQGAPSPELFRRVDATMSAATRFFRERGAKTLFTIAPTNLPMYADTLSLHTPAALRKACIDYPKQDFLLKQLQREGERSGKYQVFYPLDLFQAHKGDPKFYPWKSYHWEGQSMYLFTRHLLQECGAVDRLVVDDKTVLIPQQRPDVSRFFGFPIPIQVYDYPYAERPSQEVVEKWLAPITTKEVLYRNITENALTDKTALLIGNSFASRIQPHFARGFKNLYFLYTNRLDKNKQTEVFATVAERIHPDYVFFLYDDFNVVQLPDRLSGL